MKPVALRSLCVEYSFDLSGAFKKMLCGEASVQYSIIRHIVCSFLIVILKV